MKLKDWKKRVKAIRDCNKVTKIRGFQIRKFELPISCLIEGQTVENPRLKLDGVNASGQVVERDIKILKISGRVFCVKR